MVAGQIREASGE
jgi:hypothetical protein